MSTVGSSLAWKALGAIGLGLAAAVAFGLPPRMRQKEALARVARELDTPRRVRVAPVKPGEPRVEVTLPGTVAPFHTSVLYGKSAGYVRRNLVDVGDRVKAGQVLAEIDAPEVVEEMRVAQARLDEAEANVRIALTTSERTQKLVAAGVMSQQQGDDTRAQTNSATAAVATRKAELQRLRVLRGYQQIVAPFDGVVTRRGTDPGALVGAAGAGGVPLFEIADVEMLRVFVEVPDAYAGDVKTDIDGQVFSPRDPGKKLAGKVIRTSGVLEQSSRTLRAELHVRAEGAVLPGSFVYVRLGLPRARPAPVVPASALIIRKEGTLVARVDGNLLALAPVHLGRDFGKEVEILDGVQPGQLVVINAADTLETGQPVEVMPTATP